MIGLTKFQAPDVLIENKELWTANFIQNNKKRDYAHIEIRNQLRIETSSKCAYCESRMEHVSPSHIEHIIPKSKRPDLVCDWNNLTLSCEVCNNSKKNYYDSNNPLVNPYLDNPSDHFEWCGPMIVPMNNAKARLTKTKLKLNRPALLYQRAQHLDRLKDIIDLIATSPPPVANALNEDLINLSSGDAEYIGASKAFIEQHASN